MTTGLSRLVLLHPDDAASAQIRAARRHTPDCAVIAVDRPERRTFWLRRVDDVLPLPGEAGELTRLLEQTRADGVWLGRHASAESREVATRWSRTGGKLVESRLSAALEAAKPITSADPCCVVQVVRDLGGQTWSGAVRRRVETRHGGALVECPAPDLARAVRTAVEQGAVRWAREVELIGVASLEMTATTDPRVHGCALGLPPDLEIVEEATGLDLAGIELSVSLGSSVSESLARARADDRHWIQADLRCTSSAVRHVLRRRTRNLAAAPRLRWYRAPSGPGIRVDAHAIEGEQLSASPIARFVAWSGDRVTAQQRLREALLECQVNVVAGQTNRGELLEWLEKALSESGTPTIAPRRARGVALALLQAALDAYRDDERGHVERFRTTARRGRAEVYRDLKYRLELRTRAHSYELSVRRVDYNTYLVDVDGTHLQLHHEVLGPNEHSLRCGSEAAIVSASDSGPLALYEVDGTAHSIERAPDPVVRGPFPGIVDSVAVQAGELVETGQPLVVIESMKMLAAVGAPFAGRVREVSVLPGNPVTLGHPLVILEPSAADDDTIQIGAGIDWSVLAATGFAPRDGYDVLRSLLLGFDVTDHEVKAAERAIRAGEGILGQVTEEGARRREDLLDTLARLLSLRSSEADDVDDDAVDPPADRFAAFLTTREPAALSKGLQGNLRILAEALGANFDTPDEFLEHALYRLSRALIRSDRAASATATLLELLTRRASSLAPGSRPSLSASLDRLARAAADMTPLLRDLARSVRFHFFDEPVLEASLAAVFETIDEHLDALARDRGIREEHIRAVVDCPQPIYARLGSYLRSSDQLARELAVEIIARRAYRRCPFRNVRHSTAEGRPIFLADYRHQDREHTLIVVYAPTSELADALADVRSAATAASSSSAIVIDLYLWQEAAFEPEDEAERKLRARLEAAALPDHVERVVTVVATRAPAKPGAFALRFTHLRQEGGWNEDAFLRNLHPMVAERLDLGRLSRFELTRLSSVDDVHLFDAVARDNPRDRRCIVIGEVRDLTPLTDQRGRVVGLPHLEWMTMQALAAIRGIVSAHRRERARDNLVLLDVRPTMTLAPSTVTDLAQRVEPEARANALESIVLRGHDDQREIEFRVTFPGRAGVHVTSGSPSPDPHPSLGALEQKVRAAHRRGAPYVWEIVESLLAHHGEHLSPGVFIEHDLDEEGKLASVARPPGSAKANLTVGVICNFTDLYPDGLTRVALIGDATREYGLLAEAECRRVIAALDLASELGVPVEWFSLSTGARIEMDTGTENMDWIARVLRRIAVFVEAGGEINVVVAGINVGGQSYWNAAATMTMRGRGVLVMMPRSSILLTGKQALDLAGAVSAEDVFGIGGYPKIMGPNGEAQYWAPDLSVACDILFAHYAHTYVATGELGPRRATTVDPPERDVCGSTLAPVEGSRLRAVGDIFSSETNDERKQPFDVRSLMGAVIDQDHAPLERWRHMSDAETAVVWDAHLGGFPVCMLAIESKVLGREDPQVSDGPERWAAGTLYPLGTKKLARAINAASGNRPVVMLANLSGSDGSPESLRRLQLELGGELAGAVMRFEGTLVMCIVSRCHAGAFVLFSKALGEHVEIIAIEGSYASVMGGGAAAAIIFKGEVERRIAHDARMAEFDSSMTDLSQADRAAALRRRAELWGTVRAQAMQEVGREFERVHGVQRALQVGSIDRIIPAAALRPTLIEMVGKPRGRAESPGGPA